jgi:1-acyl-sn-glycerol-3-phosphate acyltransferase
MPIEPGALIGNARSTARVAAMASLTAAMLQGVLTHQRLSAEHARYGVWQRWMQRWCRGLLRVFGVDDALVGTLPPPARGARLVVANHRSPLDILLLLQHFGGHVLSRADLAGWPILGAAARNANTIFVDRDDPKSGVQAIRDIRNRLREGRTVIVFPEGTTFRGDEVRAFVGGAFAALRGIDVELVPVGIAYDEGAEFWDETFVQHMQRVLARPKTRVRLCIGEPRPSSGSRQDLTLALHSDVQALVTKARAALGG